jgi:hypothetical protein
MEKHQLAQALRQRQYHLALVEQQVIDEISDDKIIDSYITCSDCGEKQVTPQELTIAIRLAANANQFFDLCESITHTRATVFATARNARKAKARRRR